ncbi:hypothetical protein HPHPP28B_0583 [Helicobacter pylori Hp P-28b]|nr:hypothetical protein HPHPP28B_0583 [Helicobacter pylori Hp P-28b]
MIQNPIWGYYIFCQSDSVTDKHDSNEWNDFKKRFSSKNRQSQGFE